MILVLEAVFDPGIALQNSWLKLIQTPNAAATILEILTNLRWSHLQRTRREKRLLDCSDAKATPQHG